MNAVDNIPFPVAARLVKTFLAIWLTGILWIGGSPAPASAFFSGKFPAPDMAGCPEITVLAGGNEVPCGGTAQLTAVAEGGEAPYSYLWNTGETGPVLEVAEAGVYEVTVTDSNGCQGSGQAIAGERPIVCFLHELKDETCFEQCDGMIRASVSGGTPPYTSLWNNGATGPEIRDLCPGAYWLTVTDALECEVVTLFIVEAAPEWSSVIERRKDTLFAVAEGGKAPYSYLWSTGETTVQVVPVASGNYTVTVTDAGGCKTVAPYEDFIVSTEERVFRKLEFYPNPAGERVYIDLPDTAPAEIHIYDTYGRRIQERRSSPLSPVDITFLPPGVYFIYVLTENIIYSGKILK